MNRKLKMLFEERDNDIYSVESWKSIKEAVDIMNKNHIGALIVFDEKKKVAGIVTERDVMCLLANTDQLCGHVKVSEVMTPKEKLHIATGECSIEEMMVSMTEKNIRHIPVITDDGILRGVVSMRDIIKMLLNAAKAEVEQLNKFITGKYPA
ncbi:MAG: CBS domain-containing protein [Candidatus Cloacimonetes bacterium]|nr:CBS domain-containing protein [Candidatus Cloacimonadota bacterium]MCF7813987.1 CBS domain-containing protein [Candidatus Cloacimonadota bacterium]MCF7868615.1 CBS domain-containing protein [Candidatus Cloacimonadota bacterium]MCF7882844.1 CBS domain-containing protein [Candidatus Cloacimonadota bacterium]